MPATNVVLFLSDDHGRWALPHYGNAVVAAPNLVALARRGVVFENAYTPTPVCSPARASLLTGLRASQHGVHDFLQSRRQFDGRRWLAGMRTLPEELAAAGYQTAYVGKWHIGRDWENPPGVEAAYTLDGDYPIHHAGENGFARNGVVERRAGNLTDILTEEACGFLERRDRDRPFFLVVGYYATHSPWSDQPEALRARYMGARLPPRGGGDLPGLVNTELPDDSPAGRQSALANYYAAVTHIDQGVGSVLARLEAAGDLDNTVIAYTSDHGLCLGQHGVWGKGNATRPQNLLDDSIRVPMLMAGGALPAGVRVGRFMDHLDLHATLRAIAGLPSGDAGTYAGVAFDPQDPQSAGRELQFAEYGTARMARSRNYKVIAWSDGRPPSLHAVGEGADESLDVSRDPALRPLVAYMLAELETHFGRYSSPDRGGPAALAPGRFNLGQAWQPLEAPAVRDVPREGAAP